MTKVRMEYVTRTGTPSFNYFVGKRGYCIFSDKENDLLSAS
jgi:hypothetical protein